MAAAWVCVGPFVEHDMKTILNAQRLPSNSNGKCHLLIKYVSRTCRAGLFVQVQHV